MAYVDEWGNLKDDFYVNRGYHNKPAKHKVLGPYGGPKYPSDSDYPSPFGTDLFDRVEAATEGKQFLDNYMVAGSYGQQQNMPDYVYESLQRQMGPGYGFGDYKTEDMKNVINWNAGRLRV